MQSSQRISYRSPTDMQENVASRPAEGPNLRASVNAASRDQSCGIYPQTPDHVLPHRLRRHVEDHLGRDGRHQPGPLSHLLFELTRPPTRVAEEQPNVGREAGSQAPWRTSRIPLHSILDIRGGARQLLNGFPGFPICCECDGLTAISRPINHIYIIVI